MSIAPKQIDSIKTYIYQDRLRASISALGHIKHLKELLHNSEKTSTLLQSYHTICNLVSRDIADSKIDPGCITDLMKKLPCIEGEDKKGYNHYLQNLFQQLQQIIQDTKFCNYLTDQMLGSLILFESKSHINTNPKCERHTQQFLRDAYGVSVDAGVRKALDDAKVDSVDVPFELLDMSQDRHCAAYLYGMYFNLIPGCNGMHPIYDQTDSPLYYRQGQGTCIDQFALTDRGLKLFEVLYNLGWYYVTGDSTRPSYRFTSQNDIDRLLRGEHFIKNNKVNDQDDAANVVSVTRALFHLIGHHREFIDLDKIIDADWKQGVNAVVDLSKLQHSQLSQRREAEVAKLNIRDKKGNVLPSTWDEFATSHYDATVGMRHVKKLMIDDVDVYWLGRPKQAISYLTKLVNSPKHNHIDQTPDSIGARIQIKPSGNLNADRLNQLKILYHIYTTLGKDAIKQCKIKGIGFIQYAQQMSNQSDCPVDSQWLQTVIASSLQSHNPKTADTFEDCRIISKNGAEYQISRGTSESKGPNNHIFYNMMKMPDTDSRVTGFVDIGRYSQANQGLLAKEIDHEIQKRLLKNPDQYQNPQYLPHTQAIVLMLEILRYEYQNNTTAYNKHPIVTYINNFDINTDTRQQHFFDKVYSQLCEMDGNILLELNRMALAYLSEYILNRQSAQLDGYIGTQEHSLFVKHGTIFRSRKMLFTLYEHYQKSNPNITSGAI